MALDGANCSGVLAPAHLSFLTVSVSLVLFLITVPGNLLVCLAVYKDPMHDLRTPFNLFVVNLAFADLVVGLLVEPTSVVIHLQEGLTAGSLTGVQVIHLAYFISCTASLLSLAALTVDRYIAVTCPLYYRTRLNSTRAGGASAVIWVISATLPCVLYFQVGYLKYAFVFANTAAAFTLVILLVSYVQIYRRVHGQLSTAARLYGGKIDTSRRRRNTRMEAQVTKAFLLVLGAFLVCYLPSCVMIYIMNMCLSCSCYTIHWLRDMQFLFVLLNSSLNPFLYSWRLPNFRTAFKIILRIRSKKGRSGSGPYLGASGSEMGNSEGVPNLCAAAAVSGLRTISAPVELWEISGNCHSGSKSLLQKTTKDELTARAFDFCQRKTKARVEEKAMIRCDGANIHVKPDLGCCSHLDDNTGSLRDGNIPRKNDQMQNTGKRGKFCGSSKRNAEDSGTRGRAKHSKQKFKQRRVSSMHVTAKHHGSALVRATSLV